MSKELGFPKEIIFHLSVSGSPTNWTIISAYKHCLGIAMNAADSWWKKSQDILNNKRDTPQYICKIVDGKITHSHLFINLSNLLRQKPITDNLLIQFQTSIIDVPEDIREKLTSALRKELTDWGYFIPQDVWEIRYPAQALIKQRYTEFSEALDAFKKDHPDEQMPFEQRWSMFMRRPEGYVYPYSVLNLVEGGWVVCERVSDMQYRHMEPATTKEIAEARCNLYNAVWTKEQIDVIMTQEPVF